MYRFSVVRHPKFVTSETIDIKIDRCLRCEYELKGLPEECTCPECGLGHDPQAFSIELYRETTQIWNLIGVIIILAYFFLLLWNRPLQWSDSFQIVLGVAGIGMILNHFFSLSDRRSLLVINKSGLHFHLPGRDDRSFRWDEIDKVNQSWFTARMRIYSPEGKKIYSVSATRFKTKKYLRECITDIERMKKVYT